MTTTTYKTIFSGIGKLIASFMLLSAFATCAVAQGKNPSVTFSAKLAPGDVRAGEGAQVIVTATIPAGYHMYSLTQNPNGGVKTKIVVATGSSLVSGGKPVQPAFKKSFEPTLKVNMEEFEQSVSFGVPVTIKAGAKGAQKASVTVSYQICNARMCLPSATATVSVTYKVAAGSARPARKKPVTSVPIAAKVSMLLRSEGAVTLCQISRNPAQLTAPERNEQMGTLILVGGPPGVPPPAPAVTKQTIQGGNAVEQAQKRGLLPFLLLAIGAGFSSLLTPCVFPMVPITVSFFTKRKEGKGAQGLRGALAYCLGIIGTFTGLGLITTVLFGATGIQRFAANPWVNIGLGLLFVVLAANLLGVFEIPVPAGLIDKADSASKKGGLIAPLLMGLTFTLTSFTCTSAFVATVLLAAANGSFLYPFLGMLAFSTAFALPFFLLALFPQALAKLPRSGAWMITVKAYMGFLELAAALKFFSSADLTWGYGLLTKPIFLALWSTICIVAGLYMLGALRLSVDEGSKIGPGRRVIGAGTLLLAVFCLAAIEGKSLGDLEAFVPPSPYPYQHSAFQSAATSLPTNVHKPGAPSGGGNTPSNTALDGTIYKNYAEALTAAKAANKPLFIDFTGVNCVNCRLMEKKMFPRPEVAAELTHYVRAELYTDRGTPDDEANKALEQKLAGTIALPVYVAVTPDGAEVKVQSKFEGYTEDVSGFLDFLRKGYSVDVQ